MENLLESNERSLVIFEAVCSGLAECLDLVHADIKQMTEHRNQLIQQQHLGYTETNLNAKQDELDADALDQTLVPQSDDDPHHLAKLKLLDKRLADSFSQALSMCNNQQKQSSLARRHGHCAAASRQGILQMLLGKVGRQTSTIERDQLEAGADIDTRADGERALPESQLIIDDINRQARLAMQYSKQLEENLFTVEDLRARYEMHLKMGLVVKGVPRTYLASTYNGATAATDASLMHNVGPINSPGSLRRPRQTHHLSSLMVNDSSSLGTTTRSSLSSLNLSTWSFSRRTRRGNPSKSISPGGNLRSPSNSPSPDSYRVPISTVYLTNQHQGHELSSNPQTLVPPCPEVEGECNCSLAGVPEAYQYLNRATYPSTVQPQPRPLSQYVYGATAESATPTTMGTLASSGRGRAGDKLTGLSLAQPTMRKSASQSSLKKIKGAAAASLANRHQIGLGSKKTCAKSNTVKEFLDNIERIEAELEAYMGSFLINIEDIQGFARVCQGDVFEISIRYGNAQKFKTKISVLKDNRQRCEHKRTVFKARIGDVIAIKAHECRGLGKRLLLGHKLCDTRDLFTARSQLMTISLNQTGSIKLNLVITWNPLHMAPNSATLSSSSASSPSSPLSLQSGIKAGRALPLSAREYYLPEPDYVKN